MTESETCIIIDNHDISVAESTRWSRQSIYKIPVSVKAHKERHYTPQMVSIGPYHYGSESTKAMEEHKPRALCQFLRRSGKTLESLCQKLSPKVEDLKGAYDQLDKTQWKDEEFLQLMVRDGCFILELLRTSSRQNDGRDSSNGYHRNDPIFSMHGRLNIVPCMVSDMLMLENQIPMAVLHELNSMDACQKDRKELTKDILRFLSRRTEAQDLDELSKSSHLLDLYRKSLIFYSSKDSSEPVNYNLPDNKGGKMIRSATELKDAGITIEKCKRKGWKDLSLKDISFKPFKYGGIFGWKLKLPRIDVDDSFESNYLNLIAFERSHVGTKNEVTSYIFFMDCIIDSVEDVKLLHSHRIIRNFLGSDEAVAKLFNTLSSGSTFNPNSSLGEVQRRVSKYCKKRRHRWRAYCCHTYCSNPLVATTVLAAILIFMLTIVQTIYTILAHVSPRP